MHGTPLHMRSPSLRTHDHHPLTSTPRVLPAGTPQLHVDDTPPSKRNIRCCANGGFPIDYMYILLP